MRKTKSLWGKIYGDCIRAELIPLLFYIFGENLGSLVTVYTAGVLGQFADAVFRLDAGMGMARLWELLICLAITIFCMPILDCVGQMLELYYALVYDRVVLKRFLEKEPRAVEGFTAGEMLQRLDMDPIDLRCGCCLVIRNSILVLVTTTVLLYQALSVSVLFTLVMFAITAIKLTVPLVVRKWEKRYDREEREYRDKVRSVEGELTAEPWRIPLLGIQTPFCGRLDVLFQAYVRDTATKSIRCRQIAGCISGFLDTFCTVALLTVGALLTAVGQITPGTVAAMFGYFAVCSKIVSDASELLRTLPKLQNSRERMEFFYRDPETAAGEMLAEVEFIHVDGLSYGIGEKTVLHPVTFRVEKGEKIVLAGPNGCGKSTCLRLFTGLWREYGGSIRLGSGTGWELSKISPDSWRQKFAYAPQNPILFAGTVLENIMPQKTVHKCDNLTQEEQVRQEKVQTLLAAMGMTELAERRIPYGGGGLSGGEKQKISLARALLKDAPILILDEPGNDLDRETITWLAAYLRQTDKTVVYVSHDPVLIEAADKRILFGI